MNAKNIFIFGGGTIAHVTSHLALCAPAYGRTARLLTTLVNKRFPNCNVYTELSKMAGHGFGFETNEDLVARLEDIKGDPQTKIIFLTCAVVDYKPYLVETWEPVDSDPVTGERELAKDGPVITCIGKDKCRLSSTRNPEVDIHCMAFDKFISNIRTGRKDIFVVGFKATCGASKQEMFENGLRLCKEGSVNLVLVNDVKTRWNMIVTPEEAAYHETDDRIEVLTQLVDMTFYRSQLTFTQSTVVNGYPVPWDDPRVPDSLRLVVDHCIAQNAYKSFLGATVGHFAVKISDTEFLTSIRRSNFNNLGRSEGLVYVKTSGPDTVLAYGAKPSVGGQSQRIIFNDHPGMDCVVHFHCPLRPIHPDNIPVVSQREVECGSHQCGQQTSAQLSQFGNLRAVYLDQHGPNIVFNRGIDPVEVINFIERNFDLSLKTGGYNITASP